MMLLCTAALTLLAAIRSVNLVEIGGELRTNGLGALASTLFFVGLLGSQFLAGYLREARPRR